MGLFDKLKTRISHKKGAYSVNLAELMGLCVHKQNLEEIMNSVEIGYVPNKKAMISPEQSTIDYFNKILLEEIDRQFTHNERPFVELLMNAIDAKPKNMGENEDYLVSINATDSRITVSDKGKGMDLEKVLTTMLIPFNSDKDYLEDLGRFGVGFFSALRYCVESSDRKISIRTGNGNSGYVIEIDSDGDISGLRTKIKKMENPFQGTEISISNETNYYKDKLFSKDFLDKLQNYFLAYFDFFDSSLAKIKANLWYDSFNINNQDNLQETPPLLRADLPVSMKIDNKEIEQKIRLRVWLGDEKGTIQYYSQGIFIKEECGFDGHSVKIDFPSAVKVVEGRDDLKYDDNFSRAIDKVQDYLISLLEERTFWELPVYEKNFKEIMELVPNIWAITECSPKKEERLINAFIKNYKKHPTLLYSAEKSQAESEKELIHLESFFPKEERKELFITQEPCAYHFYKTNGMKSFYDFMQENTEVEYESGNFKEFKKHAKERGLNINVLKDIAPKNKKIIYKMVNIENKKFGRSPFCSVASPNLEHMDIYVNLNHPQLTSKFGYLQRYASRLQWLECFTSSGSSIENRIISEGYKND